MKTPWPAWHTLCSYPCKGIACDTSHPVPRAGWPQFLFSSRSACPARAPSVYPTVSPVNPVQRPQTCLRYKSPEAFAQLLASQAALWDSVIQGLGMSTRTSDESYQESLEDGLGSLCFKNGLVPYPLGKDLLFMHAFIRSFIHSFGRSFVLSFRLAG